MKLSSLLIVSVLTTCCLSSASYAATSIACKFDAVFAAKNEKCRAYSEDFCKNYDRNKPGYCQIYYQTREKLESKK